MYPKPYSIYLRGTVGSRVRGVGCGVWSLEFRVLGLGVLGLGCGARVWGL